LYYYLIIKDKGNIDNFESNAIKKGLNDITNWYLLFYYCDYSNNKYRNMLI